MNSNTYQRHENVCSLFDDGDARWQWLMTMATMMTGIPLTIVESKKKIPKDVLPPSQDGIYKGANYEPALSGGRTQTRVPNFGK